MPSQATASDFVQLKLHTLKISDDVIACDLRPLPIKNPVYALYSLLVK